MEIRDASYCLMVAKRVCEASCKEEMKSHYEKSIRMIGDVSSNGKLFLDYEEVLNNETKRYIGNKLKELGFHVYDFEDRLRITWDDFEL